ncbi:hypothetical protein [Pseudorhodoplanes sinuspersici]|uniref:Uncharacterized protein n=1 Tax=Pseudorhodoplanes sinuspersici TaxID=1235591 RepID=A0A1W6ZTV6_9HYPH|nr:hypothetical protein [Pseudorhodoplanes sinuspersici]ARQ00827.1 hypothetical protein CAK95_18330 [Pseudorhodoplanes sinuspersici]RKE72445.1 hypothetical protein DFP91_0310 [Pseudorhodoplanes sinuspersici]
MTNLIARLAAASLISGALMLAAQPAFADTLFKIVTVKDEIIVGLNDTELSDFGGDAGGIAKAIASKGSLTLWQYAVRQAKDGERQMAPLQKVGVLAASSLRVEPYKQPFKVLPHE